MTDLIGLRYLVQSGRDVGGSCVAQQGHYSASPILSRRAGRRTDQWGPVEEDQKGNSTGSREFITL